MDKAVYSHEAGLGDYLHFLEEKFSGHEIMALLSESERYARGLMKDNNLVPDNINGILKRLTCRYNFSQKDISVMFDNADTYITAQMSLNPPKNPYERESLQKRLIAHTYANYFSKIEDYYAEQWRDHLKAGGSSRNFYISMPRLSLQECLDSLKNAQDGTEQKDRAEQGARTKNKKNN